MILTLRKCVALGIEYHDRSPIAPLETREKKCTFCVQENPRGVVTLYVIAMATGTLKSYARDIFQISRSAYLRRTKSRPQNID